MTCGALVSVKVYMVSRHGVGLVAVVAINGTLAEFSREGGINSHGDVTGSRIPVIVHELE